MQKKIQLSQLITILEDAKASDLVYFNVSEQTNITDYMLICSGRSTRHLKAIADRLTQQIKVDGYLASSSAEGNTQSGWILVDAGDVIVHIMHPESRAYYNLEQLWDNSSMDVG